MKHHKETNVDARLKKNQSWQDDPDKEKAPRSPALPPVVGDHSQHPRAHQLEKRVGEERSPQLHQAVYERRDQVLRERRPRGVARTIRQKAAGRSRRTTGRLAGRIGTGNTIDGSGTDQKERNQTGARDPTARNRTRDTADLR